MTKYFDICTQGSNVHCKLYYKDEPFAEKAVVFCTGFAGHKDNNSANGFAEKLLSKQKDVIVVVFNWPAHDDDEKERLDLDDCNTYLDLVVQELQQHFGVRELFAYSTSFGGYLVLKYISERGNPFRRIALRCPAVDMYDVLTGTIMNRDEYDRIVKGEDIQIGFDRNVVVTRKLLDELKENDIRQRDYSAYADKILILHGTADEVVPFNSGRTFAENNLIKFIAVEEADHRFQNPEHMGLANAYVMEYFGFQQSSAS